MAGLGRSWESDHQDDQDDDDVDARVWCVMFVYYQSCSNDPGPESSQHIYKLFSTAAGLAAWLNLNAKDCV